MCGVGTMNNRKRELKALKNLNDLAKKLGLVDKPYYCQCCDLPVHRRGSKGCVK